jgi:hypothetical protein
MARFAYVVVVGDLVDDEILRSETEFAVGDVVPFRGEKVIVERIGDLGRSTAPRDVDESTFEVTIYRRLNCRLAAADESASV